MMQNGWSKKYINEYYNKVKSLSKLLNFHCYQLQLFWIFLETDDSNQLFPRSYQHLDVTEHLEDYTLFTF
jgi:hypothetical protein